MVHASLFRIGCMQRYLLKLSSTMSRYRFPLTVSDIDTKSTYSFSDWHTPLLDYTGITSSIKEPQFWPCWQHEESSEKLIHCSFQSSEITLMTKLHTSLTIDAGIQIRPTSPTWFLLAALVNINTPSLILNTAGSNIEQATKTFLLVWIQKSHSGFIRDRSWY